MIFIAILILTTLSIAGSAAFFSIYGLAQIFSGTFWPVVIMASSLEAGKLVAASYVYRYWEFIGFVRKTYLMLAILVLMGITSAGIFGFLSSAYQKDTLPLDEMQTQIQLYDDRKIEIAKLKQERISQRARLDAQIDAIPGNHSTNRRKMRESQRAERERIDLDLAQYNKELDQVTSESHKLKTTVLEQQVHTGPIIFIAKALNKDIDDATKWMIFLIIFAFDPLAVALTVSANDALLQRKKEKDLLVELQPHEETTAESAHEVLPPVSSSMSVEDLEAMLETINSKHDQTPAAVLQRSMVEEMLAKKKVTERVRNPHKGET